MKLQYYAISMVLISLLVSGCTKTNQEVNNINNDTNSENQIEVNSNKKISEEEAISLVKKYLQSNGYHMSSSIEVDSIDGDNYLIHAYDVIINEEESHTATTGWFEVNMYTGEIKDIVK